MEKVSVLYGMGRGDSLHEEAVKYIEEQMGISWSAVGWDGTVEIPDMKDDEGLRGVLKSVLPGNMYTFDHRERLLHSIGKSSPEILALRNGNYPDTVDAVAYPDYNSIGNLLAGLRNNGIFASVYGGGTSVTGSFDYKHKGLTVSIDARNFRNFRIMSNYADVGSGFKGMEVEEKLSEHGFTMGNFPESVEHSTVGGWLATKATGQESNQYGDIENMIISARISRSDGSFSDISTPRESAGLMVKDLSIGSEGNYGVITDASVKIHPVPEKRHFGSYFFHSFRDGIKALSALENIPTVTRLSDSLETYFALINSSDSFGKKVLMKYLDLRGIKNGAMLVVMNNDQRIEAKFPGSVSAGSAPARMWHKGRFERPYLANELWTRGLVPDTLETSASWDDITGLYDNTVGVFREEMKDRGFRGNVMAHISHTYRAGACIYFTFIIRPENEDDLVHLRKGMVQSFLDNKGSISHHHGLGNYLDGFLDAGRKNLIKKLDDPVFSRW